MKNLNRSTVVHSPLRLGPYKGALQNHHLLILRMIIDHWSTLVRPSVTFFTPSDTHYLLMCGNVRWAYLVFGPNFGVVYLVFGWQGGRGVGDYICICVLTIILMLIMLMMMMMMIMLCAPGSERIKRRKSGAGPACNEFIKPTPIVTNHQTTSIFSNNQLAIPVICFFNKWRFWLNHLHIKSVKNSFWYATWYEHLAWTHILLEIQIQKVSKNHWKVVGKLLLPYSSVPVFLKYLFSNCWWGAVVVMGD